MENTRSRRQEGKHTKIPFFTLPSFPPKQAHNVRTKHLLILIQLILFLPLLGQPSFIKPVLFLLFQFGRSLQTVDVLGGFFLFLRGLGDGWEGGREGGEEGGSVIIDKKKIDRKGRDGGREAEGRTFCAFLTFGLHGVVHAIVIVDGGVRSTGSSFSFLELLLGLGAASLFVSGRRKKMSEAR
jgi:hypothetical protein